MRPNYYTEALKEMEAKMDGYSGFVDTGFKELTDSLVGYEPGNLYIIGGRPGMGKTSFLLSSIKAATKKGYSCALVPLVMTQIQVVNRLISSEAEIDGEKIRSGNLQDYEWEKLVHASSKLEQIPLYIIQAATLNIVELRNRCIEAKENYGITAIFLDDIQQLDCDDKSKYSSREQEVSSNIRALKGLAKELGVAIIATSELNRSVEMRGGDKKPILIDLRDSGAIEDIADVIMFVYRGEYYGITEDEEGNNLCGTVSIIGRKNRHGELFDIPLKFIGKYCKMTSLEVMNSIFEHYPDFKIPSTITISSKIKDDDDDAPF